MAFLQTDGDCMLSDNRPQVQVRASVSVSQVWADRSQELADFFWERAVNRTDVCGAYTAMHKRGRTFTDAGGRERGVPSSYTKHCDHRAFDKGDLRRHFRAGQYDQAAAPEMIVGLHTTAPDNTCLWAAIEIDWHDATTDGTATTFPAALHWYKKLVALGFRPLLTDSNGRGGFHLRVFFRFPVPSAVAFAFMQWLIADWTQFNLPKQPETFPKQAKLDSNRLYGNWLRLPGRHHSRDEWSKVWDGERLADGHEAIDHILGLVGDDPASIPAEVIAAVETAATHSATVTTTSQATAGHGIAHHCLGPCDQADVIERARRYVATQPAAIQGQNGSRDFWRAACTLVIGFDLAPADARPLLIEYSDRCQPPWSDGEIDHALQRAASTPAERGYLLRSDRRDWQSALAAVRDEIADIAHLTVLAWRPNSLEFEFVNRAIVGVAAEASATVTSAIALDAKLAGANDILQQINTPVAEIVCVPAPDDLAAIAAADVQLNASHQRMVDDWRAVADLQRAEKCGVVKMYYDYMKNQGGQCMTRCHCWNGCEYCRELNMRQLIEHLSNKFTTYATEGVVYVWRGPRDDAGEVVKAFRAIRRRIGAKAGEGIVEHCIVARPGGHCVLFGTVKHSEPEDVLRQLPAGCEAVPLADAIEMMYRSVREIPPGCTRPFSPSRGFALHARRRGKAADLGTVGRDIDLVREILEACGASTRTFYGKPTDKVQVHVVFRLPEKYQTAMHVENLRRWLCTGEAPPNGDLSLPPPELDLDEAFVYPNRDIDEDSPQYESPTVDQGDFVVPILP